MRKFPLVFLTLVLVFMFAACSGQIPAQENHGISSQNRENLVDDSINASHPDKEDAPLCELESGTMENTEQISLPDEHEMVSEDQMEQEKTDTEGKRNPPECQLGK